MRIQYLQRTTGEIVAVPAAPPRFRLSLDWVNRMGRTLDRWFLGGSMPRAYGRGGFPEVEFHQVLCGRRDRFDRYR